MAHEFWLSDKQWAAIEPCLPRNQPGARRVDDRRVLSGIIHVLRSGCRWWWRLPACLWSLHHRLQSLEPMVRAQGLAEAVRGLALGVAR